MVVESAVRDACDSPLRFRVLRAPFRRCLTTTFPYSIIYTIEPEHILIIAVAHAKRKPGYWRERVTKQG